ncbi:UNVERIFIED_CONTAM: hypothetical protein GTU68_016525 [Idotea baltica]|nr:hypothetical protein [Idotea baltica]
MKRAKWWCLIFGQHGVGHVFGRCLRFSRESVRSLIKFRFLQ